MRFSDSDLANCISQSADPASDDPKVADFLTVNRTEHSFQAEPRIHCSLIFRQTLEDKNSLRTPAVTRLTARSD